MSDRTALVTGAGRGIGAATALAFVEAGFHVVGIDLLPPGELDQARVKQEPAFDYRVCDVTDEAAVASLISGIQRDHGRLDAVANIAGIVLVKPLEETTWEDFRSTIDVNLGGVFLVCKHAIPVMRAQGGGSIVNMGSVSGHVGQTEHGLYGASKGAIIALCRALAWELAPYAIRVNSVSPGSVDTPMLRGDVRIEAARRQVDFDVVKREREREQALGRWADPSEIAEAVVFLAGDKASFITGSDLLVDSGWVAK